MALDESTLANLMFVTFGVLTSGAKDEWEAIAEGVVAGLKLGTVIGITAGAAGSPGDSIGLGAIQGGPLIMVPIVAVNAIGVIPPIPGGLPTPLQPLWYLALSQVSLHVLTFLQVDFPKTDGVATGATVVTPGGFQVQASIIKGLVLAAYLKRGLTLTPVRIDTAQVVGDSVQQMMALAIMTAPVIGGVTGSGPAAGSRVGVIS